jgi:error-prone DNA polymerase
VARGSESPRGREQAQLSLPLPLPAPPDLRPLDSWERIVADYASTGVTLEEHPMEVVRPQVNRPLVLTSDLERTPDGSQLAVGGLVVARQRPATARGVVFMLLEDERGVVNVIVPPPVYEACRLAVRTAAFAVVQGKLERREGVMNLLARSVERLETPATATAEVRHIEPPADRELGQVDGGELAAVAPRAHSFGRRG